MSSTQWLKLLEVGVLLLGLALFVWWQLRDLKRARQATAHQRALECSKAAHPQKTDHAGSDPKIPPT